MYIHTRHTGGTVDTYHRKNRSDWGDNVGDMSTYANTTYLRGDLEERGEIHMRGVEESLNHAFDHSMASTRHGKFSLPFQSIFLASLPRRCLNTAPVIKEPSAVHARVTVEISARDSPTEPTVRFTGCQCVGFALQPTVKPVMR